MAFVWDATLRKVAWPGDSTITVSRQDAAALAAYLSSVPAVYVEVRIAGRTEIVMVTSADGDTGELTVTRATNGTEAQSFPSGACLCYLRDAPSCGSEPDPCDPCNPPNPWDMVAVGDGLEIDRTDPRAPVLKLKATGVASGSYGGAEVNEYGQFISVPPGWPASALPLFDPCACDNGGGGGGGGDVAAGDVSYSPCGFVGGTNVQDALCQLEQWATGLSFEAGVLDVTAGDGIVVTGPTAHPVVALQPTGIAPGTYAGFDVNEFGQITNFTSVAVDHPSHTAVAPLHVTYDAATNTWTHTVDWADENQPGVVQFVSVADIINNSVPPAQDEWAISHRGAYELVQREINALGIAQFDISALPAATPSTVSTTDLLAIYNGSTNQHESISISTLADFFPAAKVLLEYDPATLSMGASRGVSGVTPGGVGVYTINLVDPLIKPVIHANLRGDLPAATITVEITTATTLTVRVYDLAVSGTTLAPTAADHPFYLSVHEDV